MMKTYFKVIPKIKPSPGELNSSEACPHCKTAFVDFADIMGNGLIYGCYVCGVVFMSPECIAHEIGFKRDQVKEQEEWKKFVYGNPVQHPTIHSSEPTWSAKEFAERAFPNDVKDEVVIIAAPAIIESVGGMNIVDELMASTPFIAKCGKQCKNLAGLKLHEMRCKECLKIG